MTTNTRPPICFYHSADLDGKCSGAIVRAAIPNVELYGINYGDLFPWDKVQGRDVVMVDFSLQPFSDMVRLKSEAKSLVWIDHHKSALADAAECGFGCDGRQDTKAEGCELAWDFYFGMGSRMPRSVQLLGRYDVWDHADPDVLPFQYGARMRDLLPDAEEWGALLDAGYPIDEVLAAGRVILAYEAQQNAAYVASRGYVTVFDGHRAIVCNRGLANSKLFDSIYDPEKHDLMITFCRLPTGRWTFSLYSTKLDCGSIARRYGGGGHPGAAGFQADQLPEGF